MRPFAFSVRSRTYPVWPSRSRVVTRRGKSTKEVFSESYIVCPAGTGIGSRPCRGFGRCLKKRRHPGGVTWALRWSPGPEDEGPRDVPAVAGVAGAGGVQASWAGGGAGGGDDGDEAADRREALGGEGGAGAGGTDRPPCCWARSISSGIEERTVSSAGNLALASKSNSPVDQVKA